MLFFLIGLILLVLAVSQILKIRTYGFQNKKVLIKKRITLLLGGAGILLFLYGLLTFTFS